MAWCVVAWCLGRRGDDALKGCLKGMRVDGLEELWIDAMFLVQRLSTACRLGIDAVVGAKGLASTGTRGCRSWLAVVGAKGLASTGTRGCRSWF
jgi:hypothetical protein